MYTGVIAGKTLNRDHPLIMDMYYSHNGGVIACTTGLYDSLLANFARDLYISGENNH